MNLEAIEKRCEAATPGPWEEKTNRHPQCNGEPWGWIGGASGNITWSGNSGKTNASFIAHAREDIPALIAEVKSITARAEKAEMERDKAVEDLKYVCGPNKDGFEIRSICDVCKHKQADGTCDRQCEMNTLAARNRWEWRGKAGEERQKNETN